MKKLYIPAILMFFIISALGQNAYLTYNKAYGQLLYENYEGAIALFTQAINEKPDIADAYSFRGLSYHNLGQLDKAIEDYIKDNSFKKDRSSYNLACAYALQGKKDDAFRLLEQSQKSEYKKQANIIESDTDFEKLKSDPRWKNLLTADVLTPYDKLMVEVNEKFGAKNFEGSIQACEKAIGIDKADKRAWISKAYILSQLEKNDESIAEYDKLIGIDASDFEGYAGKANVYFKLQKYSQALPLYETAAAKNPYYMPLYEMGMCKFGTGKKDAGIEDIKKYCEIFIKDDMTLYTCGRFLYDMERDNEALIYAEKAIALNKSIPEYFMLRAYVNHVKKNWDTAISDYSQVIVANDKNAGEAYYKRGLCKAEKFAISKNASDKSGFCSDMKSAIKHGITEAAQYTKLCE